MFAYWKQQEAVAQQQDAQRQAANAETARQTAEKSREREAAALREAQLNQSRFSTDSARRALERGDATAGLLLALEAVPDEEGGDDARSRPHWPPAMSALTDAVWNQQERLILSGHTNSVNKVAVSPDGSRIVSGAEDNTVRIWDALPYR